ncbi:cell division protein FtsQ/DivIB [Fuscovulum ytuae]|uniref:Cell division protein FtsQ n=1 Tax=Fuscovulum ytuae TaxID=3042299 RepID=A0ABY8Q5V5_9RHOB|nr:cell division protein FtsQ/DivIB [Fuscovulum sp. YMD61]WGV16244.1 cell division protein FtsQ/DivIB [Fuscovulum sp. YMD61]
MRSLRPEPRDHARAPRRDPAPTRWQYRMQRLWLTPYFRVLARVGLPVFLISAAVGLYAGDEGRRAALVGSFTELKEKFQNRPEFMVKLVSVDGASPELAEAIRGRLDLKLPLSSFDIDLAAVQARVEALDAVAQAELRVRSGGVLQVQITERMPVVLWRVGDRLEMLDKGGHRVAGLAARTDRPDLPLIAGEGADQVTGEALEIFAAAQPILSRVRGLVRMGERRWDLVLDRNQRILLPEVDAVAAMERLIALDRAEDLLARDVLSVDLRNDKRPTLRLAPFALNEHRKAMGIDVSGSEL